MREDVLPPLVWTKVPEGTREFALVCHDPDAPLIEPGTYGYVHGVHYNIPGAATELADGTGDHTNGLTDFGDQQYRGPAPPPGHDTHRYFFWLFALDVVQALEAGLTM